MWDDGRHRANRPVIVEGILLLATLEKIGVKPGYLIFVENAAYDGTMTLGSEIDAYLAKHKPRHMCDFLLARNSDD